MFLRQLPDLLVTVNSLIIRHNYQISYLLDLHPREHCQRSMVAGEDGLEHGLLEEPRLPLPCRGAAPPDPLAVSSHGRRLPPDGCAFRVHAWSSSTLANSMSNTLRALAGELLHHQNACHRDTSDIR
jgi:hypothetical protein